MKYKKKGKTWFTILEKGTKNKLRLPLPNNSHARWRSNYVVNFKRDLTSSHWKYSSLSDLWSVEFISWLVESWLASKLFLSNKTRCFVLFLIIELYLKSQIVPL